MFGFMNGGCDPTYRRLYALCCQNQFLRHGRLSTLFHSYESVFLASLACDLGWIPLLRPDAPRCCRLLKRGANGKPDLDGMPEEIGAFLAAFAMLLTWIKLQDDIRDSKSLFAISAKLLYRRQFRKAIGIFEQLDPAFRTKLDQILASHAKLECSGVDSLERYCQPTADGFQYLFELFAQSNPGDVATSVRQTLSKIGARLGQAIIAFDCAVDWKKDRRRGEFNPLREGADVDAALLMAKRALVNMGWELDQLLSQLEPQAATSSMALRVIRSRFDRIAGLCATRLAAGVRNKPARSKVFAFRKGDCDCCCPLEACAGGGDCCSLDCCSLDCGDAAGWDCNKCEGAAACCDGCSFCPCEACSPACDCCDSRNSKAKTQNSAQNPDGAPKGADGSSNVEGQKGIAVGPLNPQGIVEVEGKEYPASAQSGFIDDGAKVEVVAQENFGLLVRPAE